MTLHHELAGPEGAPVLLLAHSLGTSLEMWEPQLPALSRRFRVLLYDQRGHGRSGVPTGPYTADELGRDALELLDRLGLERVSFCGLSLGGMIGMWLAAHAPDRLDRLVLCCTSARFGPEGWDERAAAVRNGGVATIADAVLERWFTRRFHEERPAELERYRQMLASTPAEGYAGCCEAIRDWDVRDRLSSVSAPTLVVAGADDAATPPEQAQLIAGAIPDARVAVLPGAAHLANVEQPEAFDRAVLDHLGAA